ncbi:hypothetical protein F5884DRAFT_217347 [Xylogone sp. PMI_703]|nr:hypothetical protein F5884DRAFT_217347 [Xylogone sp. PMI_703]
MMTTMLVLLTSFHTNLYSLESHNFAEIYTNQAQRSDSTSPAYIAATTVLSPTGYHQLPLHITGDSQPVSSNTSILSPEPTRVSSSRPEQKINLRYDSQESSMAYSRATPHITTKLYYDLLPIDTISESEATEKKRELFAISPSLTPPLNPDLTSIEDHKMLQTQKQGFRRSTNSSSSDSGSSTIIHRLTSPQYITKSHDMSDLSIHGDVAETPSSIVSPRSNISSVITPRRSRDSETPLRICPSPPVRYQIYNDTLPSSIQPQTPDQLPEARHQSRYHPSYTIPNNNRFALSRLLFDNITPRSSSQHSGSPLGRAMDRGGVRMPSPIGLSDEGYRGLFGGRENTGD